MCCKRCGSSEITKEVHIEIKQVFYDDQSSTPNKVKRKEVVTYKCRNCGKKKIK